MCSYHLIVISVATYNFSIKISPLQIFLEQLLHIASVKVCFCGEKALQKDHQFRTYVKFPKMLIFLHLW